MDKIIKKRLPADIFFSDHFPFYVRKFTHLRNEYGENYQIQRDFWKIIYIISGHGEKLINGKHYKMNAGSIYLIHPNDKTSFIIDSESLQAYNILFLPEFFEDELKRLADDFNFFSIFNWSFTERDVDESQRELLYIFDAGKEVYRIAKTMESEYYGNAPSRDYMLKLKLLEMLIYLSRRAFNQMRKTKKRQITDYIEHFINNNYSIDLSLKQMASGIGVTPSYLCRLFKSHKGISIFEYLKKVRMENIRKQLLYSNKTISEICYDSGFNDLSYFYRAFRLIYGLSPGQFRKERQK